MCGSYQSCQVGTSVRPCFKSSQLESNCFDAWLKYRPSVAKAAFSSVTTAVPAEPVKPEMKAIQQYKFAELFEIGRLMNLFVHHKVLCIPFDGRLPRVQLWGVSFGCLKHAKTNRKYLLIVPSSTPASGGFCQWCR